MDSSCNGTVGWERAIQFAVTPQTMKEDGYQFGIGGALKINTMKTGGGTAAGTVEWG
jgi:hypothetical protein